MTKFIGQTKPADVAETETTAPHEASVSVSVPEPEPADSMRVLLEKNLKWSQIIYEQNRKINSKLLWMAVADWLRVIIIVTPLILAVLYLPVFYQKLQDRFGYLLNSSAPAKTSAESLKDIIKALPLNELQRQELQTILK